MTNTFLHKKFQVNLNQFLYKNKSLLIAISGGQDSICLLKLFYDFLKNYNYTLQAIYIDHQWKKDSISHTKHMINIMRMMNIPCTIYQMKNTAFSESETRQTRYKILIKHAINKKCDIIATAHNQNDTIETLLKNFIRGTSLNGISNWSIHKQISEKLCLVKPLINYTKEEISWFCRSFCLPVWSDVTNYNYSITRNRLRYELVPYIQNYFNPNIISCLTNFLAICKTENDYIKENTIKLYLKSKHNKWIGINLNLLKKQHSVLEKRVVQLFFYYNFNSPIHYIAIDKVINIAQEKDRTMHFKNLTIQYQDGWLYANFAE